MNRVTGYQSQPKLDVLVEQHSALVKRVACHLLARLPASVQLDDLIQSGMIGLIEAAKTFDATKGASFETFAGIRIRGAMIDEMRRGDWAPRSVHRHARAVGQAINDLEVELGREPSSAEVAAKLEMPIAQYHQVLNDVNCTKIMGIADLGVDEDVLDTAEDEHEVGLFKDVHSERFQGALAQAIEALPERDALVLSLYYNDEMNLKEIGQILDVSESRVSQIHSQAMVRLRAKVVDWIN